MSFGKTKKETPGTFSNQSQLPRLPVADLNESCQKLLQTLEPLAENRQQYEALKKDVEEFLKPGGRGAQLQERLIAHDQNCAQQNPPQSWIDKWWLNLAYLSNRTPLPIYSSVHMGLHVNYPVSRETRAACISHNLLKMKDILDREELPPQRVPKMGNLPLCMDQYRRFFSTNRTPHEHLDELIVYPPEVSKHIVVMYRDHIYSFDAYPHDGGKRHLTEPELKSQLDWIVEQEKKKKRATPVGLLTAGNRDLWGRTRDHLIELSKTNKDSLDVIESCIFMLCLDEDYPTTITEDVALSLHGGPSGRNRWFDKNILYNFFQNGHLSLTGEHAPGEATQPGHIMDWVLKREAHSHYSSTEVEWSRPPELLFPRKLEFVVDDVVLKAIDQVAKEHAEAVQKPDLDLFHFSGYGNHFIKKAAKVSPDSWFQVCLQLAYYRMYQKTVPTYETASLRQFLNGRTETCRPGSLSSVEFCKAFDDPRFSDQHKMELFKKAVTAHVEYMMECFNGRGWDRHILGLRVLASEDGEDQTPALFQNPLFKRANQFTLSTSNISPGRFFCGGFGIIDPQGYGVCYLIEREFIWINICSDHTCPTTSTAQFKKVLIRTLLDVADLFSTSHL